MNSAAATAASTNERYPVLDPQALDGLLAFTDADELSQLLSRFIATGRERISRMEGLGREGKWDDLRREAHSMISLAGNLGLRQIQHLSSDMEMAIINGDRERAAGLLTAMLDLAPTGWEAATRHAAKLTSIPA